MTFDEQLQRALETLSDRLRDDLNRGFQAVSAELGAAARADREAAAAEASERVGAEAAEQARQEGARAAAHLAQAVTDAEARARTAAEHAARERLERALAAARADLKAAEAAASERLTDAVSIIGRARSLTETLDALVACAGREMSRAGLLLVRDDRMRSWGVVGFPPDFDQTRLDLPLRDSGLIGDAVRSGEPVSSLSGDHVPAGLNGHADATALPVVVGGQVVAVLYADRDSEEAANEAADRPAAHARLQVMVRHASQRLEALTALGTARLLSGQHVAGAAARAGLPIELNVEAV
jgi:hypothetical protein